MTTKNTPPTDRPLTAGDDELIERGLRMIRSYDAVRFLRDALSATTARLTSYDWNADPDGITKQQGDAFSIADRVFADLKAAVDATPEIDLPECQTCGGTGKIEEAAKTEGANQHSACVRTCDDCDGCGFAPDAEEPAPARPATSAESEGALAALICAILEDEGGSGAPWSVIADRIAASIIDENHLAVSSWTVRAALERIAGEQQYRSGYCQTDITVEPALSADEAQSLARETLAALASPPVSERERELEEALRIFRAFVQHNATQWEAGSNHHHPAWLMVAEALGSANSIAVQDGPEWRFIQPDNRCALSALTAQPAGEPTHG